MSFAESFENDDLLDKAVGALERFDEKGVGEVPISLWPDVLNDLGISGRGKAIERKRRILMEHLEKGKGHDTLSYTTLRSKMESAKRGSSEYSVESRSRGSSLLDHSGSMCYQTIFPNDDYQQQCTEWLISRQRGKLRDLFTEWQVNGLSDNTFFCEVQALVGPDKGALPPHFSQNLANYIRQNTLTRDLSWTHFLRVLLSVKGREDVKHDTQKDHRTPGRKDSLPAGRPAALRNQKTSNPPSNSYCGAGSGSIEIESGYFTSGMTSIQPYDSVSVVTSDREYFRERGQGGNRNH